MFGDQVKLTKIAIQSRKIGKEQPPLGIYQLNSLKLILVVVAFMSPTQPVNYRKGISGLSWDGLDLANQQSVHVCVCYVVLTRHLKTTWQGPQVRFALEPCMTWLRNGYLANLLPSKSRERGMFHKFWPWQAHLLPPKPPYLLLQYYLALQGSNRSAPVFWHQTLNTFTVTVF